MPYLLIHFSEHHISKTNGRDAQIAAKRLLEVVLLFESQDDVEDSTTYVHRLLGSFDKKLSQQRKRHIPNETELAKKVLSQEICNSQALKKNQPEWQCFRVKNS